VNNISETSDSQAGYKTEKSGGEVWKSRGRVVS